MFGQIIDIDLLPCIFCFTSPSEIQKFRLVSQRWNEIILKYIENDILIGSNTIKYKIHNIFEKEKEFYLFFKTLYFLLTKHVILKNDETKKNITCLYFHLNISKKKQKKQNTFDFLKIKLNYFFEEIYKKISSIVIPYVFKLQNLQKIKYKIEIDNSFIDDEFFLTPQNSKILYFSNFEISLDILGNYFKNPQCIYVNSDDEETSLIKKRKIKDDFYIDKFINKIKKIEIELFPDPNLQETFQWIQENKEKIKRRMSL